VVDCIAQFNACMAMMIEQLKISIKHLKEERERFSA
jgi:hypothetical protein